MHNLSKVQLNNAASGASYFIKGLRMLWRPELRKYILIPFIVNCILFIALTALFIQYYDTLTHWDSSLLPPWLAWLGFLEKILKWIFWVLITALLLIGYGYGFNMITNIFAAPFYGLLAQRTEEIITGNKGLEEPLYKMVPRTVTREAQKLLYFIIRGIFVLLLVFLLGTIPLLNFLAPIVALLWGAWSMALQYVDYSADNHQTPFRRLRKKLRKRIYSSVGFGGMVMGCSMIPFVNIIAMPVAVIGGTMFWVNELKGLSKTKAD